MNSSIQEFESLLNNTMDLLVSDSEGEADVCEIENITSRDELFTFSMDSEDDEVLLACVNATNDISEFDSTFCENQEICLEEDKTEDLEDFEVDDSWEEMVLNLDANGTGPFSSSAFNLGKNPRRCLGLVGVPRKIPRTVLNPPVTPEGGREFPLVSTPVSRSIFNIDVGAPKMGEGAITGISPIRKNSSGTCKGDSGAYRGSWNGPDDDGDDDDNLEIIFIS